MVEGRRDESPSTRSCGPAGLGASSNRAASEGTIDAGHLTNLGSALRGGRTREVVFLKSQKAQNAARPDIDDAAAAIAVTAAQAANLKAAAATTAASVTSGWTYSAMSALRPDNNSTRPSRTSAPG